MSDLPALHYPPALPVSERRDDILRALTEHQVVIVAGATGSGKTTQLPKMLLEIGCESIGHTQPRRIAARTVAERIAEELGDQIGGLVGYQVRFTDKVGAGTRIKLMTDGILLNEIHRDRDLRKYDAIIIDEAHERSLTVDFLLGYLKQLLPRRPDLKVVITSATIDPESFSKHFDDAPIIEVSGRTYPVEIRYRPLVAESSDDAGDDIEPDASGGDRDYLQGITDALDELAREEPGDVLVFLSGENEIRDAEDAIRGRNLPGTEVLPLYGRLSAADQHRVFETRRTPGIRRRVVLATNVAETSLTVPGIRYVVDAGTARISRYSVRSKIQRLPIEAISQASANQRSGRSGRTSPGIAIRLYSEEDFARRPEFTEPEILRTNLAAVILQMISLGLGDIEAFPFLQKPDSRGVKDGLDLLKELGAIDASVGITRIGRQLSQLPIDPRFARMVLESKRHGTTREVMVIVAGLSIQDVRERPLERRAHADQLHARFVDPTSDFITLLNLWNHLEEKQRELSGNAFRRLVRSEYLNYLRVREWQDVYRQLVRASKSLGLHVGEPGVNPDGIHRSLLAGLLSHIGLRDAAKRDYVGARQARFVVFPGSALAKKQPAAVMSAELVETSRLFARSNAAIDAAWAEPIAGDLVKRSHSEPHWEKRQGSVVAYERVTLYGVPIVARRRIQFSRVDPGYARDLFIRHALVEGEWDVSRLANRLTAFLRDNAQLRRRLEQLEERTRRRDILVDDEAVVDFYSARIPADVSSTRGFESWWRTAVEETPDLLTLTERDLLGEDAESEDDAGYPVEWRQRDQRLKLTYRFEPGAADDGLTVVIPLPLLAGMQPDGFDWLVPGMREELVTAMIKALPKHIRKNVVPAADWARKLLERLPAEPDGRSLGEALAVEIRRLAHTPVEASDFDLDRIPAHLTPTFAVVDERGRRVGAHTSLRQAQAALAPAAQKSVARAVEKPKDTLEREGITSWDIDALEKVRDRRFAGNTVRAYPAFVDRGDSVALSLLATRPAQQKEHRRGVLRLLALGIPSPVAYVQSHLTNAEKLALAQSPYPSTTALFDDCLRAVLDEALGEAEVFTRADFEAVRDAANAMVLDRMFAVVSLVARTLTAAREADKAIKAASGIHLMSPLGDARTQLEQLVYKGFVSETGAAQLVRLPVYLTGVVHRVSKLAENVGRDRVWQSEVELATQRYRDAGGTLPPHDQAADLTRVRWLLEELRLSLFAQTLGTAEPVSVKRIVKALNNLGEGTTA
jgi:ATP-dependent helicase HrpA